SVFPRLNENLSDPNYITSLAILPTQNEYVNKIKMRMIGDFLGGRFPKVEEGSQEMQLMLRVCWANMLVSGCSFFQFLSVCPTTKCSLSDFRGNNLQLD
ncbi:hypothetical protein EJB05_06412, partial [Eragrostis curvula]